MTHWSLICGVTSIGPDTGQLIGILGILTKQEATKDEDGPDEVDSDVSPSVVDTSSLQGLTWDVCFASLDKTLKQAGLSRATLEISSEFSSNFPLRTLNSYSTCFEVIFYQKSSSF